MLRAFDPLGARAAGYRIGWLDLVLNVVVALVVVAAVRAVGVLLVIALLVVPAAAGRLVFDRLALIAVSGVVVTLLAAYVGLLVSYHASINLRRTAGRRTYRRAHPLLGVRALRPRHPRRAPATAPRSSRHCPGRNSGAGSGGVP